MDVEVIWEDDWMVVINKPAGMVVNRAETVQSGASLQDWIERRYGSGKGSEEFVKRSGIVHRLDKDTSGVMVVAKEPEAFRQLKQQFQRRQVQKTYLSLVYGRLAPKVGAVSVPIGRSRLNREKFAVMAGGREAVTRYRVKQYYQDKGRGSKYTLLELQPKTGRTHQLRVHLAYLGHPVAGDSRYAGVRRVKRDELKLTRQWLHSARLVVAHPGDGRLMTWVAGLPAELAATLQRLEPIG